MAVTIGHLGRVAAFLVVIYIFFTIVERPKYVAPPALPTVNSHPIPRVPRGDDNILKQSDSPLTNEEKFDRLMHWLNKIARDANVPLTINLTLSESKVAGMGVVSTVEVKDGETMFVVPREAIMGLGSASRSHIAKLLENRTIFASEVEAITMHLLFEKVLGRESEWLPFVDFLPAQPGSLLYWTAAEVAALQDTSLSASVSEEEKTIQSAYYRNMIPLFTDYPEVFPRDVFTYEGYKWAWLAYKSRRFVAENVDGVGTLLLVPLGDLLNHNSAPRCDATGFFYDPDKAVFVFNANSNFAANSEIFNCYMPAGNTDMLLNFGFSMENNMYNHVPITSDPNILNPGEVFNQFEGEATIRKDSVPLGRFLCGQPPFSDPELSVRCRAIATARLQYLLDQYPTTLQQDRDEAQKSDGRMKMAIIYRMRHKMILSCAKDVMEHPDYPCPAYNPPAAKPAPEAPKARQQPSKEGADLDKGGNQQQSGAKRDEAVKGGVIRVL